MMYRSQILEIRVIFPFFSAMVLVNVFFNKICYMDNTVLMTCIQMHYITGRLNTYGLYTGTTFIFFYNTDTVHLQGALILTLHLTYAY